MRTENAHLSVKTFKLFQTGTHHSNCREELLGECKGIKYYSDQHLMVIKVHFCSAENYYNCSIGNII